MATVQQALLGKAKKNKKDEFYTRYEDIEKELSHYGENFRDKIIYCNCDDVRTSNFYLCFARNFKKFELKSLICAGYRPQDMTLFSAGDDEPAYWYEYDGTNEILPSLSALRKFDRDGDFRSEESIALLKRADIVVTNPPFSLFRSFVAQLMRYDKKFLVIASINALTYKDVFKLIQQNRIWLGVGFGRDISAFIVPEDYPLYGTEARMDENGNRLVSTNNCCWLTNLEHDRRYEWFPLSRRYEGNEALYPGYVNADAINVDRASDIPQDYEGMIGVPITFLRWCNPAQFEIVGFRKGKDGRDLRLRGRTPYVRMLIRHKLAAT